jgi:hypothetical protein
LLDKETPIAAIWAALQAQAGTISPLSRAGEVDARRAPREESWRDVIPGRRTRKPESILIFNSRLISAVPKNVQSSFCCSGAAA